MSAFGAVAELAVADVGGGGVGATINIPADSLSWADADASPRAGKRVAISPDSMTWIGKTPSLRAGKRIAIPVDSMTLTEQRAVFSVSAYVRIPADTVTWIDRTPSARAGARINIANEFEATYSIGSAAEDAVASDALLAGIEFTRLLRVPDNITWSTTLPRISSGGSAMIPADPLTITEQRVEIGARRRKLRVLVAAS